MNILQKSILPGLFIAVLIGVARQNYLLFHSLAELFSIVIAFGIFVIGWNSRKYYKNNYLLFIGVAYLFVAFFDILHTLAYKGMTVFNGYDDNNLPPQLWLVARYMESIALLLAPLVFSRPVRYWWVAATYAAISLLALYAIFFVHAFPVCFITGSGLTPFKVGSEYLIDLILLVALYLLYKKREHFDPDVLKLLALSIACTMITELCFTVYVHLYGLSNLVGHIFKIFAFYFMYKAIIETALAKPYDLLFKNLQESEERFKALSEATFGGIIIHDNGLILECNEGLSGMTGFSHKELIGMNGLNLIAPESLDTVLANIRSGYDQSYEVTGVCKDGTRYPLSIKGKNVTYKGHEARIIEFRDITEFKQAEEEQKQLEMQLLQAQKFESLGVLAGGIAHDFNNILMAIIGNAELALMRIHKDSPAVDNLNRIEQSAARAADLAKQMLAYSGRGQFVIENLDINHLLNGMLHMLEVSISKKVELHLNLLPNIPLIEADAVQIQQIIMNLLINASEAIGDNSGNIVIITGSMKCDSKYLKDFWPGENIREGLYVTLEITDTGCGMDKETLDKIFDPFFTTKFTGRGLGMAAVHGIVRGHKGAINVRSEPDKGTSLTVLLPASGKTVGISSQNSTQDDWRGKGKVLLVDDEETVRDIGKEMLNELGFTTITANDGKEALEVFKSNADISFVILDLTMPQMDGTQCFKELQKIKPEIKVVISSGFSEREVAQRFVGNEVAGFIQKPYKLSVLKEEIKKL